ncbi:N-acetyl-gamma-glutamyl-phosphate reductase [Myceligenerans cantabricum]
MSSTFRVAVAGASGYAGGEMLRLLVSHPLAEVGAVTAHTSAGSALGEHQPHLRSLAHRTIEPTTPEALAGHDVVVLALPHGASGEIAARLPEGTLVLDLGADHRLTDAGAWQQFYGSEHAGSWPYGLPELILANGAAPSGGPARQRDLLRGATRVAVPGCNVTAVTLGLQPGIAAGLVEASDVVAVLANGYSGAGKSLRPHLLASEALGSAQPYAVGGTHRHVPEIIQNLRHAGAPGVRLSLTPTLVPMARGILATATAPLAAGVDPATAAQAVREAWLAAYDDEPFVHLLPEGQWPSTAMTQGANTALVQVVVDEAAGRVVTVTAIDNLVKGTAGQAVQAMNIALGLAETTGLPTEGVAP